ncbi:MAG: cation-translocating P-type ATPase, partial [Vulcanimicrobiaceae bacterium]
MPRARIPGLTTAQATQRLVRNGPNVLPSSAPKSIWALLIHVVTEPMFLMLLVAGGIYLALGDRGEALFLLSFVFVVIGISLAQEHKTQRALESLRDLSAPRAIVVRDGEEREIPSRDVVCDDVLVLHEGRRISADCILLDGLLSVDESLLTGEAVPVDKTPESLLFASTVITKGTGYARVTATGIATEVGKIGDSLARTTSVDSGLTRASAALVRTLSVLALALACGLILVNWLWDGRTLLQSLLTGIALAMAILPEEIPVILTVFLALGAWRMAKINVLTRRIPAIEALGAITVLAVDKTGTLTHNRMEVAELSNIERQFATAISTSVPEAFHRLVEFAMLATPSEPFDPMEKAIQTFGHDRLAGTEHIHDDRFPEFKYELSADILAMTRVFSGENRSQHLLATKGAPEAIADLCHLDEEHRATIATQVEAMAARGLRVLGVARGEWQGDGSASAWPASQHDFTFAFLGLIGFLDPPRQEVSAAIAQCRSAGVRILMLTGDHPATASAIAQQVGLSERPGVITGSEIDELDDATVQVRLAQVDICARLRPEQKLRLVHMLQQRGDVVAMTGDGVNDAPALKAADVGIAMGAHGTDVAREAAGLVLLDDRFASIVAAIQQGRRIFDNITKATRFVFSVHMPIIALALFPALFHWPILLLPVHIVVLQLLIDPACSIVFEAEPPAADSMTRPPRMRSESPFSLSNLGPSLVQGFGIAAILLGSHALLQHLGWSETAIRSSIFLAIIGGVLLLVFANRATHTPTIFNFRGYNPWMLPLLGAMVIIVGAVYLVPPLRNIAGFATPDARELLASLSLVLAIAAWL